MLISLQAMFAAAFLMLPTPLQEAVPPLPGIDYAQQQSTPDGTSADESPAPDAAELAAQNRQQLIDAMVDELNKMVPGDHGSETELVDKLYDIVNYFLNNNVPMVRTKIEELKSLEPDAPPADLILAALSFAANNPAQGRQLLERLGVENGEHPALALAFARLALAQNRLYEARTMLDKALQLNAVFEQSEVAKREYEQAALNSLVVVELRRNQREEARRFTERWQQLDPDSDQRRLVTADLEFRDGNVEAATKLLEERTEESRKELPTAIAIGRWFRGSGDREKYQSLIADAYQADPKNAVAQIEYASLLLLSEDFESAESVVDQFIKLHGESSEASAIRGRIAFSRQRYGEAEQAFEQLFRSQPNNIEFAWLYGLSLLESEDPQKQQRAVTIAQRTLQRNPANQLAMAAMGWSLLKVGNADVAKQFFDRASRAGEMLPDTAYFLAEMMASQDRNAQAKILLDPFLKSEQVFLYRAAARQLFERLDNADSLPVPGSDSGEQKNQ